MVKVGFYGRWPSLHPPPPPDYGYNAPTDISMSPFPLSYTGLSFLVSSLGVGMKLTP